MQNLDLTLNAYRRLLKDVDNWFADCLQAGGSSLACRGGCSACCRALFDITLLDAWLLKRAFADLHPETQEEVMGRCQTRLAELRNRWPALISPYLLNALPEEEWLLTSEEDQTPCPLLDENGLCLVYDARPMICRLHGLPNIDISGEDFEGTVCSLHKESPLLLPEQILRWRFRETFTQEVSLFRLFTQELTGRSWSDLDTYIPLALSTDYTAVDWYNLKL